MNIIKLLELANIPYKKIEYTYNIIIYKIKDKENLVVCKSRNSSFKIDRDLFYYLYNQKIGYSFLLINTTDEKYFLLEKNKISTWLKSSFDNCDKNEIFFGKLILQYSVSTSELSKIIKKMH